MFRQNGQLWVFGPKFAQKWILGSEFEKSKSGFGISILEIPFAPIFRKNGQLYIFGPKFAQKWILWSEFQKSKSEFGINTSKIPCVPIFSQNGQLLSFQPKFGEIAQLRAIFWFEYCWGCCGELAGGWNELGGGGWNWVEVGARFSNTPIWILSNYTDETFGRLVTSTPRTNFWSNFSPQVLILPTITCCLL